MRRGAIGCHKEEHSPQHHRCRCTGAYSQHGSSLRFGRFCRCTRKYGLPFLLGRWEQKKITHSAQLKNLKKNFSEGPFILATRAFQGSKILMACIQSIVNASFSTSTVNNMNHGNAEMSYWDILGTIHVCDILKPLYCYMSVSFPTQGHVLKSKGTQAEPPLTILGICHILPCQRLRPTILHNISNPHTPNNHRIHNNPIL